MDVQRIADKNLCRKAFWQNSPITPLDERGVNPVFGTPLINFVSFIVSNYYHFGLSSELGQKSRNCEFKSNQLHLIKDQSFSVIEHARAFSLIGPHTVTHSDQRNSAFSKRLNNTIQYLKKKWTNLAKSVIHVHH